MLLLPSLRPCADDSCLVEASAQPFNFEGVPWTSALDQYGVLAISGQLHQFLRCHLTSCHHSSIIALIVHHFIPF